jgi:hypothetical protein
MLGARVIGSSGGRVVCDRKDPAEALAHLDRVLARAERLEPSEQELELAVELAVELERAGQLAGLALDGGESTLCAIALLRGVPWLHTGDKRAIKSIEALADSLAAGMAGRVRCLEQLALGALSPPEVERHVERQISGRTVRVGFLMRFMGCWLRISYRHAPPKPGHPPAQALRMPS